MENTSPVTAGYRLPARSRRRLALIVIGISTFAVAAWLARVAILQGGAELWIVSESVSSADAVVVLGGGLDVRPFAASRYYRDRLAGKIVIANVRSSPA